jgi:putative addiction module component (TIGR02574 family)
MSTTNDKLASEIRALPDVEKLRLVDAILTDLDKPDPEIDRIWAEEARRRWAAYKAGRVPTISYEEVMTKPPLEMNIRFLSLADQEVSDASNGRCETEMALSLSETG